MRDLDQFPGHIEEPERVNKWSSMGKVTLMTIHQAKALECKRLIVPGLDEGILPHPEGVGACSTKTQGEERTGVPNRI